MGTAVGPARKPKPVPRAVRELGGLVRDYARVNDWCVDVGAAGRCDVEPRLLAFLATVAPEHDLRHHWEKATPELREAVWEHWDRIRGKSLPERAAEHCERHNARLRARYGMFARSPDLLAEIGLAFKDPVQEAAIWVENARKAYLAALTAPPPPPTLYQKAHQAFLENLDIPIPGREWSMNQVKVWSLLTNNVTGPNVQAAHDLACATWPDDATRRERLKEMRHRAYRLEMKHRRDAREAEAAGIERRRPQIEMDIVFSRAYAAIVYLCG